MSKEKAKPYVVTADVNGLMKQWAENVGYVSPDSAYYDDMSKDLQSVLREIFKESIIDVINPKELKEGIIELINLSDYPPLLLDRAYFSQEDDLIGTAGHIDITRAVDENLKSIGIQPRPGYPSVKKQIENVASSGNKEISIVDDVLFSGSSIIHLSQILAKKGVHVKTMIAGVAIKSGSEYLMGNGIEVVAVHEYESVIDEVCERDFRVGVPMSGRTIYDDDGQVWSAPYLKPFGDPKEWASIPNEYVTSFSLFLISQSIDHWKKVESDSRASVPPKALPRRVKEIDESFSIKEGLEREFDKLKHE